MVKVWRERHAKSQKVKKVAWGISKGPRGTPAAFDSEHDENLGLTSDTEKKFKITKYRRLAIARDIQGKIH